MGWFSIFGPSTITYVNNAQPMTVAALMSNYPAAANYLGMYARVSDLWGGTDEVMRCSTDGSTYFWRPQRTDYAVNNNAASGAVSLIPLVSAPIHYFTANLSGNITVTPSATNAWPGAQFTVVSKGVLGLFGINLNGLIGGGTLSLLTGNERTMTYTAAGWQAN